MGSLKTLNELYSSLSSRRRYEVWFIRLGLSDNSGAWWFRYLLMNPGRCGCVSDPNTMPVQVWTTWFPRDGKPESFIQGFSIEELEISARKQNPFHFRTGNNEIDENSCRGELDVNGHKLSWKLHYRSTFRATLSNKGWIGFSRTPHSDAVFFGSITLDGRRFEADPLGYGVQGHNCGYRHRGLWKWTHAHFLVPGGPPTTLEALVYDMPFGFMFRKAVLWHAGGVYVFKKLYETTNGPDLFRWNFFCRASDSVELSAAIDGSGPSLHHLPYAKTDCSGSFEVANNSLATASLQIRMPDGIIERLETDTGAVLEMAGLNGLSI